MIQLLNETPRVERANSLVLRLCETLAPDDVQLIYDHEPEAAEIGRKLVAVANPTLSREMDKAYNRFFHADFHYLINVIETAESGTDLFALYWKREPASARSDRARRAPAHRFQDDARIGRPHRRRLI